jgi:hypothetical protein
MSGNWNGYSEADWTESRKIPNGTAWDDDTLLSERIGVNTTQLELHLVPIGLLPADFRLFQKE